MCTRGTGPPELAKQMSSDAKSQEKLWFHLVRFHHFTSDKTQGRVTCPRVYVGSWQEPFSLRSEADLSPTHARARTHTHTHTHTHTCTHAPHPSPASSVSHSGNDRLTPAVTSLARVWASLNGHNFVSYPPAGSDSTQDVDHGRGCIPSHVPGTRSPGTVSSPRETFSREAASPRYLPLWLHSDSLRFPAKT